MTADDATLLATLPAWAFGFVLVMARIGGAITLLPGLGEPALPAMLRVGLAFAITALLLPEIEPSIPPVPEASLQAAGMIVAEGATGLWIGWLARLLVLALPVAGQFIAYMLGIANVLQPDPELGGMATPIERLLAIAAPLAILMTGLYALPLAALAASYRLIPPGTLRRGHRRDRGPRDRRCVRLGCAPGLALPAGLHRLARRNRPAGPPRAAPAGLFRRHARTDPRRDRIARGVVDRPADRMAGQCPLRLCRPAGPVSGHGRRYPSGRPDRGRNPTTAAKGA
jgi:hypothetical protein